MLRRFAYLFITLNLFTTLYADEFAHCFTQVKQSYKYSQSKHLYHTKYGWILFSPTFVDDALRSEPLLGLYLMDESKGGQRLKMLDRHPNDVAAITSITVLKNHIVNEGLNLDHLAVLKKKSYKGLGLFGACCTLRGFVADEGVVTSEMMLHFLRDNKRFATAGIRLEKIKGKTLVQSVNPFFASNPFRVGDEILYFDGKKRSFDTLTKEILFAKVGSKHQFRVKRNGSSEGLQIYLKKRLGGGVLAETYLEQYGLRMDSNLNIVVIDDKSVASSLGLMVGDTLKSIDNKVVSSDSSVRALFAKGRPTKLMRLLIERKGLQFSVYFPKDIMLTLDK